MYLHGIHCSIYTDYKPLLGILGPHKPTPVMASACMERWILTMSTYKYDVFYRRCTDNANADGLSGEPLPYEKFDTPIRGM